MTMGIKAIFLFLTTLLVGAILFTETVLAAGGYCSSTIQVKRNIQRGDFLYLYVIDYPSYKGSSDCLMSNGAQGTGVKALQTALNNCYGQSLDVDSKYGDKTKAALKVAQKAVKTNQDGIYGPKTGGLIKWWAGSFNSDPDCIRVGSGTV